MPHVRYLIALFGVFLLTAGETLGSRRLSRLGRGIAAAAVSAKHVLQHDGAHG